MSAKARGFEGMLKPRAIAVVGASADPKRIGGQPARILRDSGFRGGIYPVNPKYREFDGFACYPDLAAVPKPCDLAIVAVNAAAVPGVIRQCGAAGIPYAVVFSAGFREVGSAGLALERELRAAARDTGVRVIGPNCIGTMNLVDRVYCGFGPGFANASLRSGPVAFVSQSGGFAFSAVALADHEGIGFNYVISSGNEADIGILDLVSDFLERDDTEVVVAYIEGITDGRRLRAVGRRALELGKPILVWKVGNTDSGRTAAESHTASMTAGYALYRAAFEEGGYVEVTDVHDMVDAARAFLSRRLPAGPNLAILTTSGGSGVLAVDAADRYGLRFPAITPETVEAVSADAPKNSTLTNPIDLTAQVTGDHERFNKITRRIIADPNVDTLMLRYGAVQGEGGRKWAEGLADIARETTKPIFVAWSRVPDAAQPSMQVLEKERIPWILTPIRCAQAAGMLYQFSRKREFLLRRKPHARIVPRHDPAFPAGARTLSESQSKQLLAQYGIPVTREALLREEDVGSGALPALRFPVAVKIDSPDIPHKTEAGAVRLGVANADALRQAARDVLAAARRYKPGCRINGVLVSEMAGGVEIIAGAINDRYFGPVVMAGLGGTLAELLQDVARRFGPFDADTARELIAETRAAKLLAGYRGGPPLAIGALADTLARLSQLAADHEDRIAEIDVNPLFVGESGVVAADALVVLRDEGRPTGVLEEPARR